jgi:hypothetical protein
MREGKEKLGERVTGERGEKRDSLGRGLAFDD